MNKNQNETNQERLNDLYDQYAGRVMGYLLRLTRNTGDAEDLTQETFLAAFENHKSYRARGKPLAWLLGIAWRRWRDRSRKAQSTEPLGDIHSAPGDFAADTDTRLQLDDALRKLPEAERNALLLTAVQGLTYKEAAQITGEPVGTVKWRVHTATRALRILLASESETTPVETTKEVIDESETDELDRQTVRIAHASGSR